MKIGTYQLTLPVALIWALIFCVIAPPQVKATNHQSDSLQSLIQITKGNEQLSLFKALVEHQLTYSPAEALLAAREYYNAAVALKNAEEEAEAAQLRADASYYLGDFRSAIQDYQLAASTLEKRFNQEHPEYIKRLGDIGYSYKMLHDYGQAIRYYQDALDLALKTDFKEEIATSHNNLGQIFTDWGEYGLAAEHFYQTLAIDKASESKEYLSTTLNNLGKVYELWGKFDQALAYYQEALAIDQVKDDKARIAVRLNNIGTVYFGWDSLEKALDYFNQALAIERTLGDNSRIGRRLAYIGEAWFKLGEFKIASGYFQQAKPFIESSGTPYDRARLYHNLAHDTHVARNQQQTVQLLEQSNALAMAYGLKPLIIKNYKSLADLYEKSGDALKALHYYQKFAEVKDSVFSTESDKRLSLYQSLYENEKIRHENEILITQAGLRKKNLILLWVLFTLLLVVAISLIIILRFREIDIRQKRIIAEREAENLKKDLELKNNELTYNAMCIVQTNEAISKMGEMIREMMQRNQSADQLNAVLDQLKSIKNDKAWQEFELRFTQVHSDFYDRLQQSFPDLTPNEKKLCAFLRLNMTTKDIAAITHQSVHSINVARTRLRKKMNLANSEENLVNYLMAF